ncbi:hypothetical protein B0T25DRAFT_551387 [Lasiosphaeria hispida]|uniref:Uncharacterized protein n=1 Tax=Lasiosphaeria hispida TaxID=260671 RepID=A0AAJ0HAU5_9PEZI|nr:hypothetical protein B0T25DRAFT_551387 [Lasiosphaeria hispida]
MLNPEYCYAFSVSIDKSVSESTTRRRYSLNSCCSMSEEQTFTKMLHKRKRSESELSFNSTFSSPTRPGTSSFDFAAMKTDCRGPFSSRPSTPSYLHSRTMKRFRDNRPSDEEVHQRTLSMLYSAQQQQQQPELAHTQQQPEVVPTTPADAQAQAPTQHDSQQRSLHSFWSLPVTASTSATSSVAPSPQIACQQDVSTSCDDCGVKLAYDTDAMAVKGEDLRSEEHSCGACGKTICFSCSISNLGEHRRCLACAERKVLVGGIGWTTRVAC